MKHGFVEKKRAKFSTNFKFQCGRDVPCSNSTMGKKPEIILRWISLKVKVCHRF
jgi:hypothetical protein